jgi:FkbM family methyltransferase
VITQLLSDSGVWQPAETAYLQATLRPGQTFVDVGAHVGYFSVLASKLVGPTGTVIAVEPESRNLELLRRNLARNGCTNTLVVPFAARSTRGWLSPARDEANRGSHRLMRSGEPGTMVRCVRLDDLLPSKVDVVKIDAQGYDHDVVEGLERTFLGNPQLIVIAELATNELERIGVDPAWVLARYEALGYDLSIFDQELRLRRVARERVLALHQPRKHPLGFSVVLSRAEKPRFSGGRGCPAQVDGLEVDETSDGLTVFQPIRDQVHQLNLSAAIVFELCTGENSPAEITKLVHKIYRLPDPPADEVARCLDRLWQEGLVM